MSSKYELIDAEKVHYPIVKMCEWMAVSTSGYYEWRDRPTSATARRRDRLRTLIEWIFDDSDRTYGHRRIHAALARQGESASPELMRALMRELGLVPCQPQPWRPTTTIGGHAGPTPDLLARNFTADAPGTKLVGDITYIPTWEGWLYLATVIDCHTKASIGYALADHMRTELVVDALNMAARNYTLADSEPETSSFIGTELALVAHLTDVHKWARSLAKHCGLPPAVVDDLALAAELHDLGKVDSRFQLYLRGGGLGAGEPIAKSTMLAADYRSRRKAQLSAGYPLGTRHELASVALVEQNDHLRGRATDWDLVLHLVASHHGYGRPFMPPAPDPAPVTLTVTHAGEELTTSSDHGLTALHAGVPGRFWRCVRRYGWYGLAWLEAILRLADHRASEMREGR